MRRFPRPDKSTPLLEPDGKTVSQAWFDFFGYLDSRGLGNLLDVNSATAPTNGQVLIYNSTTKLWVPGAN
jgi:hypothetical protein